MESDMDPETLEFLSRSLVDTLAPEPESRLRAEENLSTAAGKPNYTVSILRLIAEPSIDDKIRQFAAVNFKHHLKTRRVPQSEKDQIKTLIVPLILSSTPKIQAHLTQSLALIEDHDHLRMLMSPLLPELNSSLQKAINGNDFASVIGILSGVNSLFKSDPIHLKYFAATLLSTVESISGKINTFGGSAAILRQLIEAQRLCFKIFYSLTFLDLPEFFKDNVDKWMNEFKNYLTVKYPLIEDDIGAQGVSVVDELRVSVCENITYYTTKEEEVFQKYLKGFVEAVCSLFVDASSSPSRERLTMAAIKFLTIVSTSVHHALLSGNEILQQITQSVVIPVVMLRDEDEELFETNYVEFIRRDMEGGDLNTRRRIVRWLLKGISGNYKDKVTESVSIQIRDCLTLFAENPGANWKYKDCAIYLVCSLSTISTDLVDIESFFRSVIVPELRGLYVNVSPMLEAGALKFFTMFRVLIPKPLAMTLLGDVARFLCSDFNVVHSYAASCIEKLLLVKDNHIINGVVQQSQARYTSLDINPVLPVLMPNLLHALEKPCSEGNQYIMRCMMRVLQIADISSDEVALPCIITLLGPVLEKVCENPKNPVYNHCLFKAIATLGHRACEKNPSLVPAFETCLKPSLMIILGKDKSRTDFMYPYALQLLAQVVELRGLRVPTPHYECEFEIALRPNTWEIPANVPGLVRLFQLYVRQSPGVLNWEGVVQRVVGIFKQVVSVYSPSTEEYGFHIINPVVKNIEYADLAQYVNDIWASVFARLQHSQTPRLVRCVIVFLSLFLVSHGTRNLVAMMNSDEEISFRVFLGRFWIPYLKTITGDTEVKLCAVASTRLICESKTLVDPAGTELWGKLLDGVVTLLLLLLSPPQPPPHEEEEEEPDFEEAGGYRLLHCGGGKKEEEDHLKEIKDPKQFSVALLAKLSSQYPGRFPPIIATYLSSTNQAALLQLCISHKVAIL